MIGPEGVTRSVVTRLQQRMGPKMAELRAKYSATVGELPDVQFISPDEFDPLSIEKFPAIMVFANRTTGRIDSRQTDVDIAYDEYSFAYEIKAYMYARGDTEGLTSRLTARLALGVREVLLEAKMFPVEDYDDGTLELDPTTLAENFTGAGRSMPSEKFIGSSELTVNIRSTERLNSVLEDTPVRVEPAVHVTGDARANIEWWKM